MDRARIGEQFRQTKLLYWNLGNGAFRDVTAGAGPALSEPAASRGSASGDLDGDGTLETVVINMNARPAVLKNMAPKGNAAQVEVMGTKSNRAAIGARVVLAGRSNGRTAVRRHSMLGIIIGSQTGVY